MIFDILIGVILTIFVEIVLFVVYNLGKRSNKIATKEEITLEEVEKAKKINEGWNNIFNYNVDVAYGRGEKSY